jgi:SAM-dependent methyltransferase
MGIIVEQERTLYEDAWGLGEKYSAYSPGEECVEVFCEVAAPPASVLDAGCGAGKGALALQARGFEVWGCDLTPSALPDPPPFPFFQTSLWADLSDYREGAFDWVYCVDVLEHLPTQFTMLAIYQMLLVAKEGVFIRVSNLPDAYGVWVGRDFHQCVQPYTWWRDSLREIAYVEEARDLIGTSLFVIRRAA